MSQLVDRDEEHLRLLKLCYYILAGMTGFFTVFPTLFFALFGAVFLGAMQTKQMGASQMDPRTITRIFLSLMAITFGVGAATTFLAFLTARSLGQRRRLTFSFVIAALSCFYVPWGTAIGVCTIVVLNRPSVKALFGEKPPEQSTIGVP